MMTPSDALRTLRAWRASTRGDLGSMPSPAELDRAVEVLAAQDRPTESITRRFANRQRAIAQAVAALDSIHDDEASTAHAEADDILLQLLRALGVDDVADAWVRAEGRVDFRFS